MVFVGVIVAAAGVVLAANLAGAADVLAGWARPFPVWMRAPYSDTAAYYRVLGVLFVAGGLALLAVGLRA